VSRRSTSATIAAILTVGPSVTVLSEDGPRPDGDRIVFGSTRDGGMPS
jgi:hypothetical protein